MVNCEDIATITTTTTQVHACVSYKLLEGSTLLGERRIPLVLTDDVPAPIPVHPGVAVEHGEIGTNRMSETMR